jgi:ATP-dependent RNA helicase RhlE
VRAVAERGYVAPTPVQAAAVSAVLAGRDVWASAETGSGKTAAFVLPLLQVLAAQRRSGRDIGALIVVPTRELAAQIGDEIRGYGVHLPRRPRTEVVVGGVSINPQMLALRGGADILVATPGRLLDLAAKNAVSLSSVATLVLDEADRLLAEGFADELHRVLELLPSGRQTLLFSATFPSSVQALAAAVLRDPVRLEIPAPLRDVPAIQQRAIEVDRARRTHLLRHLIVESGAARTLVFVATTYATEHVADKLRNLGIRAGALHGKLAQGARTHTLADFRAGRLRVVIATDVAARGLDIEGLDLVVSYDLPRSPADYLHRIGRTGRAGANGVAIAFVTAEGAAHFRLIEKRHHERIERERIPGFEPKDVPPPKATGGVKGKRRSKKDKLREAAARAAKR